MRHRWRSLATRMVVLTAAVLTGPGVRAGPPARSDFEKSFAAVVIQNCLGCHNASERKGKLDLTRERSVRKGGRTRAAVVPGKPEESYLIHRVAKGSMPPKKTGRRLSGEAVAGLRAWVKAGARWPVGRVLSPFELTTDRRAGYDWWSLKPLSRPPVPEVRDKNWLKNPIDAFVAQKLEQHGLAPALPADRVTYLRRAKYDLLGLPPTPEEIDAFVVDRSPDAYEKLIDRLLASPHYGERWGRHWLDVARFGESDGFERDGLRDHAWPYRDYVIRSFNQDKPYRQFAKEQLAGDVLRPVTRDGIIATGFLVAGPWDEIQNVAKSKLEKMRTHEEEMEELLGAVGQTFLGLTVNCARCHDHKFDPIPQTDYYRLKAVFDGVEHGDRPALTPDEQEVHDLTVAPIQARIDELKKSLARLQKRVPGNAVADGFRDAHRPERSPPDRQLEQQYSVLRAELQKREEELAAHAIPVVYSGGRRQPAPTFVFLRGDIKRPGSQVTPGGLSPVRTPRPELGLTAHAPEGERRRRFAEWAANPDNPLTARVMVNRIWQYHFGQGLVSTPSDFGFNGGLPSHADLLDWLAREFIAGGGSVKRMHRLIMLSAAYRQSSRFNPRAAEGDADDRLLWRFAPRRLEGEVLRDAMLAVSGELTPRLGGPSFRPFTVTVFNSTFYHVFDRGTPEFNRRTVYRISVNTGKSPLLDALDCPAPSITMPRRRTTTTPLQALALMNDSFVLRQADRFAGRVRGKVGKDGEAQVRLAYRLAFGRPPDARELAATVKLVREHGLESACWVLMNASEFLYVR